MSRGSILLACCCCWDCDCDGEATAVAANVCTLAAEIAAAIMEPVGSADDGGPFAVVVPGGVTLTALWLCDAIARDSRTDIYLFDEYYYCR